VPDVADPETSAAGEPNAPPSHELHRSVVSPALIVTVAVKLSLAIS